MPSLCHDLVATLLREAGRGGGGLIVGLTGFGVC